MNFSAQEVQGGDHPSSADRRQFERSPFHVTGRLLIPGMPAVQVQTLDLSVGGLAVISPTNPEPGTLASIQFPLKLTAQPVLHVEVMVTVMHGHHSTAAQGYKLGLRFNTLSGPVATLVARYVLNEGRTASQA